MKILKESKNLKIPRIILQNKLLKSVFQVSEKYLSIPKDLKHVSIKSLHCFIITNEDLLLYGRKIQGIRDLLIVLSIPGTESQVSVWYSWYFKKEIQMIPTYVTYFFFGGRFKSGAANACWEESAGEYKVQQKG